MTSRDALEDLYPLTPVQSAILFQTLANPDSGLYTLQTSCRLEGRLDPDHFRSAIAAVVRRHPALRTGFVWQGTPEPLQFVLAAAEVPVVVLDWQHTSAASAERSWAEFLEHDRTEPFDIEHPSLMRVTLVQLGPDCWCAAWTMHHLVVDGWSHAVVVADTAKAYQAITVGQVPEFEKPALFRDFLHWRQSQDDQSSLERWRRELEGFTTPTPLPGRSDARSTVSGREELEISLTEELATRIRLTARSEHVTLNTMLQGAWAMVLSYLGGTDEVVFGTTLAGRPAELANVDESVGVFVDTLPVPVRIERDQPWSDWLRALNAREFERRSWGEVWLADVVRGQNSRGPLFESVITFQNYPFDPSLLGAWAGMVLSDVKVSMTGHAPLVIDVNPADSLRIRCGHDPARVDQATVELVAKTLVRCLEWISSRPGSRVGETVLVAPEERSLVLRDWNSTRTELPERTIHSLVSDQARLTPDSAAIIRGKEVVTFKELEERANRLAHYLRGQGVRQGSLVAVATWPSVDTIIVLLAVLKAGGAYVPLDPGLEPEARLRYILADTAAPVVVTVNNDLTHMVAAGATVIRVDEEPHASSIADQPSSPPTELVSPDQAAYVIYTSGTTGKPKGVVVEHRSVANFLHWMASLVPRSGIGAPLVTSFAFDMSVTTSFVPLVIGKAVVLANRGEEVEDLLMCEGEEYTFIKMTPSQLKHLSQHPVPSTPLTKLFILGGERLDASVVEPWLARWPDLVVLNEYGPTEATVGCSTYRFTAADGIDGPVPIGRPGMNMSLYVLDTQGHLVPPEVPGELYIGGRCLARGYWRQPELTAERFVRREDVPEERLYRTGDRARWRSDGVLEFLGRDDDQIKVRGYRVEPSEVSAALGAHPGVDDCTVIGHDDRERGTVLVAYVVPSSHSVPTVSALRLFLRERLPSYMVPSYFIALDQLPLTANGKLDLAGLPQPDGLRPDLDVEFEPPQSETEIAVADIWAELLDIDRVGVNDDFFDLGGDSLVATRLLARVCDRFAAPVSLRELFGTPTVRRQAEVIESTISSILDEIEALSDDEVRARLNSPAEVIPR